MFDGGLGPRRPDAQRGGGSGRRIVHLAIHDPLWHFGTLRKVLRKVLCAQSTGSLRLGQRLGVSAMAIHTGLLRTLSRSDSRIVAAVADNCRFDERAGDERWHQFGSVLSEIVANPTAVTWQDWTETNKLYVERYCHVPRYDTPDAFLPVNETAWLGGLSENQSLVRIETIGRPLLAAGLSLDDLRDSHDKAGAGDADALSIVRSFCETWNQSRDGRPMFAAFYDEVKEEADHDDWALVLRNRLGLGHYGTTGGTPLDVALMRYPMSYVLGGDTHSGHAACSLPTVLDGGMHEFFFPVPKEHPFGSTLHLEPNLADMLTSEIVHRRIDYRGEHILRLGRIGQGHQLEGESLAEGRDLHLVALQIACDRDDFGELFEGRT